MQLNALTYTQQNHYFQSGWIDISPQEIASYPLYCRFLLPTLSI